MVVNVVQIVYISCHMRTYVLLVHFQISVVRGSPVLPATPRTEARLRLRRSLRCLPSQVSVGSVNYEPFGPFFAYVRLYG